MSSEPIDVAGSGHHDDTPWVIGVLSGGGRYDGREVRLREGDLPHGFASQGQPDWTAYLTGRPVHLPPPTYWRWTGRTDRHGRAVFEPGRPEG
jgi:hypothetical protein